MFIRSRRVASYDWQWQLMLYYYIPAAYRETLNSIGPTDSIIRPSVSLSVCRVQSCQAGNFVAKENILKLAKRKVQKSLKPVTHGAAEKPTRFKRNPE